MLYNDKWIVTHIPKCGGTSLGEYLPKCGLGFRRISSPKMSTQHIRLEDLKTLADIDPASYRILAIIRDPIAREKSYYSVLQNMYDHKDRSERCTQAHTQTFDEFVCDKRTSAPHVYATYCQKRFAHKFLDQWLNEGWDDYLFWLAWGGHLPHPKTTVVKLEEIDEALSRIFGKRMAVPVVNRSEPTLCELSTVGEASIRSRYHWALRYYGPH